jgi:hypothetical protein
MNQTQLLGSVMGMEKGQRLNVSLNDMERMASQDLPFLDRMAGGVNERELKSFLYKIEKNWNLYIEQDFITQEFIIEKR